MEGLMAVQKDRGTDRQSVNTFNDLDTFILTLALAVD